METRGGSGLCNGATDQPAIPSSAELQFRAVDTQRADIRRSRLHRTVSSIHAWCV